MKTHVMMVSGLMLAAACAAVPGALAEESNGAGAAAATPAAAPAAVAPAVPAPATAGPEAAKPNPAVPMPAATGVPNRGMMLPPGAVMMPVPLLLQQADANGDLVVDDAEAEVVVKKAADSLREQIKRRNKTLLDKYDTDKDGRLSPEEVAAAKKAMREMSEKLRKASAARAAASKSAPPVLAPIPPTLLPGATASAPVPAKATTSTATPAK